jgi:7-cyano-7-deazaguanine reductase
MSAIEQPKCLLVPRKRSLDQDAVFFAQSYRNHEGTEVTTSLRRGRVAAGSRDNKVWIKKVDLMGKPKKATKDAVSLETMKYGERAIQEGELFTFPNPRPGRHYSIQITLPEFTCTCPFSGYPDFATIYLTYVPDQKVVELKAIKLYINRYRDQSISHEEGINRILDDFVAAVDPLEVHIKGDYNPRGNVHTVVEVQHKKATAVG